MAKCKISVCISAIRSIDKVGTKRLGNVETTGNRRNNIRGKLAIRGKTRKGKGSRKKKAEHRSTTPGVILNWWPCPRFGALLRWVDGLNSVAVVPGPGKKESHGFGSVRFGSVETGRERERGGRKERKNERKGEGRLAAMKKEKRRKEKMKKGGCVVCIKVERGRGGDGGCGGGGGGGERIGRKKGTSRVKTPKLSGHCRLVSF